MSVVAWWVIGEAAVVGRLVETVAEVVAHEAGLLTRRAGKQPGMPGQLVGADGQAQRGRVARTGRAALNPGPDSKLELCVSHDRVQVHDIARRLQFQAPPSLALSSMSCRRTCGTSRSTR